MQPRLGIPLDELLGREKPAEGEVAMPVVPNG